ncbi:MAG: BMP family ABC transporter substrate-binding protein [Clostridia bacterium]|nr:BMP family ABC transporter substrate-binding protein [Clostridia bacterium]
MNNRTEALNQYLAAQKQGKKYYNACVAKGVSPYPQVLNELVEDASASDTIKVGLVDIPSDRIVGTWTDGRKAAFAGNFMPLLDVNTEFGSKWVNLCEAHLGEGGITDPITCIEYLGNFYVQEGNKRVSVLKSYDSPSISGIVTRLMPPPSDDPKIKLYYEFLKFYKASKTYLITFTQPGSYAKLQAALGFEPDEEWTDDDRRGFSSDFRRFSAAFQQLNTEKLPLTAGDALLTYIQVHPFTELKKMSSDEIKETLSALWPDIQLLAQGEPISVSTEPEKPKEKTLISRILGSPRLHAAFIYDFDPEKSAWAAAHRQGQHYLEEKLGASITVSAYLCGDSAADDVMEKAVSQGANVIFATSPTLIGACRRVAAEHKNVAVFNCSLSMPYAEVRSYYCRIYEGKFITGAIAGAMAQDDKIGYVANYPIMGVTASINAFALGARLTNPRAKIMLKWSCMPGNPILEFKNEGIKVISNRDEDGANTALTWDLGTYKISDVGGLQPLAAPRWNWGSYYEKTVRSLMNGGIDSLKDLKHANNDWWGLSSGVIDLAIGEDLPDGVKMLANILQSGIAAERIDPFLCPIKDQQGHAISDGSRHFTIEELMHLDWLCDNIEGSIPGFDELLPRSQSLVRLLGLYRDYIPPKTEEVSL